MRFEVVSGGVAAIRPLLSQTTLIALKSTDPAVNLRLLGRRNFGLGTLANIIVGFALHGTIYILPQYPGQVFGYSAELIGFVLAWTLEPPLALRKARVLRPIAKSRR